MLSWLWDGVYKRSLLPGYGMVLIRDPCYMLSSLWDGAYKRSLLHAILVMGWCLRKILAACYPGYGMVRIKHPCMYLTKLSHHMLAFSNQ